MRLPREKNKSGLPLCFMRNQTAGNVIYYFPLCILLIGIIIHIVGLFNLINKEIYSLWNVWVDVSMLFIDISAFYGLLTNKKWGYYESIAIFIIFGLVQLFLGVFSIATRGNIPFEIQNLGALIVCVIAAICLCLNNDK
ncbi:MAG: hypothetical protein CVU90_11435 [Firmicutes bacterium HGW-Firmicutes-15]|nr:MAG: hypothetical protein CVU90_11435 [Firmicutes bacterium HGW-Firmicutes-15]